MRAVTLTLMKGDEGEKKSRVNLLSNAAAYRRVTREKLRAEAEGLRGDTLGSLPTHRWMRVECEAEVLFAEAEALSRISDVLLTRIGARQGETRPS